MGPSKQGVSPSNVITAPFLPVRPDIDNTVQL